MKNVIKKMIILSIVIMVFGCSKDDSPAEVVKTKVKVTGYRIESFSFVAPDGYGWDGVSGYPDVYCGFFNGQTLLDVTNTLPNINSLGLPLTKNFSVQYEVPSFSDSITTVVMDSDQNDLPSSTDDEIGYVTFIMSDYTTGTNKYPATVTKTANGVTATLFLIWE